MSYPDIIEARVIGTLEFQVRFSDGLEGRVEMRPGHLFGVFERLKDPDYFKRISVNVCHTAEAARVLAAFPFQTHIETSGDNAQ
ncbi:MAG: DUF2442 domain-containing protein [Alphaproteobacteria bacterium]|nr:DUF2442 domain-containing protein [Alphaproteobacteria bacterium]